MNIRRLIREVRAPVGVQPADLESVRRHAEGRGQNANAILTVLMSRLEKLDVALDAATETYDELRTQDMSDLNAGTRAMLKSLGNALQNFPDVPQLIRTLEE